MKNRNKSALNSWGIEAEIAVSKHYEKNGFYLVKSRERNPGGEIDLIMENSSLLIFVEVKARRNLDFMGEIISQRQWKRIEAAALFYISGLPKIEVKDIRFDAAFVSLEGEIIVFENSWLCDN